MADEFDLVSKLSDAERQRKEFTLRCISPDDAKYADASQKLVPYLTAEAEWQQCVEIQKILLETRMEYGLAEKRHLDDMIAAMPEINLLNIALLEDDKRIMHDQLSVIAEIGRHVMPETKALLHPGTTSYDILDTARSYLFRKAWKEVIRPEIVKSITQLCDLAEKSMDLLQVGRTHLQNTSPITFGWFLAGYAGRLADRLQRCDLYFDGLRGKISGIVGTGASIEAVIGKDNSQKFEMEVLKKLGLKPNKSMKFEEDILKKLGLEPDYTATQIVQKERLADVGHGLTTMMLVLADLTNDIRMLYSSAIGEVTSRDNAERLGGSSADALKNNPVQYENNSGKAIVIESGMLVLYEMIHSDFQRDLRGSVQARYQPQPMMVETYEAFRRLNKALPNLSVNEDRIAANLESVRKNPSEAMVAILRGEGWLHSKYGAGHDFVKEIGKTAIKTKRPLLQIALEDTEFREVYEKISPWKQEVLQGKLEEYKGSAKERGAINIAYAREAIKTKAA